MPTLDCVKNGILCLFFLLIKNDIIADIVDHELLYEILFYGDMFQSKLFPRVPTLIFNEDSFAWIARFVLTGNEKPFT